MAVVVNGRAYHTLADEFFVNGAKVYEAYANGVKVYPDLSLPAYIRVTKPPTKTEYEVGEEIDYTGIEVTAYFEDGTPWGVVPFDELVFPVKYAPKENMAYGVHEGNVMVGDVELIGPIEYAEVTIREVPRDERGLPLWDKGTKIGDSYTSVTGRSGPISLVHQYDETAIVRVTSYKQAAHSSRGDYTTTYFVLAFVSGDKAVIQFDWAGGGGAGPWSPFTFNGTTEYGHLWTFGGWIPPSFSEYEDEVTSAIAASANPGGYSPSTIIWENPYAKAMAWYMLHGEFRNTDISPDKIPVQWKREDGEILEATFAIEVTEPGTAA